MDTTRIHYCDLINTICQIEQGELGGDLTIELYSIEGYPLACKPISYIKKLTEWRLDKLEKPFIYAIPRWKIFSDYQRRVNTIKQLERGNDLITLKENNTNFEIKFQTDCTKTSYFELLCEIQNITGIPSQLFQLKNEDKLIHAMNDMELCYLGIKHEAELELIIQDEFWTLDIENNFNHNLYEPTWSNYQGKYGISLFYSCIFSISNWMNLPKQKERMHFNVLGHIRSLSGCPPLIHSLNIVFSNETITLPHTVAITEVLFKLFEVMKPKVSKQRAQRVFNEILATEYSNLFWAFFITESKGFHSRTENFVEFDFVCSISNRKMNDPVQITDPDNMPYIVDRSSIIETKDKITTLLPNYKRMVTSFNTLTGLVWECVEFSSCPQDLTPYWDRLAEIIKSFNSLNFVFPLSLKNRGCQKNIMVPLAKDNIGIFRGRTKLNHQIIFLNLIDGITGIEFVDELDRKVKKDPPPCMDPNHSEANTALNKQGLEVLTRKPEEIIMVLLDVSGSMLEDYFDGTSKFTSVIEAFTAFSDRSSAYNFKHVIGLTCIRQYPTLIFPFSENFVEFADQFNDFVAGGGTSIYDSIYFAINCFKTFLGKNPETKSAVRRILCLTDGEDNCSLLQPTDVVPMLIKNNIIMDTVLLCRKKVFSHLIAKASGGYSFQPKSSRQLLQIFEQEPMLTMKIRKHKNPLISAENSDLFTLTSIDTGFDTEPEHVTPEKLNKKAILPELYLTKAIMQKKISETRFRGITKRIFQELAHYQKNPHPHFEVFPMEKDIDFWHILIDGPEETPYSQGVFHLYIEFTKDYPDLPPHIRFVTPIYHCNINSAGRICHSIIDRSYTKGVRVRDIFDQLFGLLMCPDDSDPLDSVKAIEHHDFPDLYFQNARDYTERCANKHMKIDLTNKILGDNPEGAIQEIGHLVCPLTRQYFVDPVLTVHGKTYEREAILEHLKYHKYDPFSFQNLTEKQLFDNAIIKEMVTQMRNELDTSGSLAS